MLCVCFDICWYFFSAIFNIQLLPFRWICDCWNCHWNASMCVQLILHTSDFIPLFYCYTICGSGWYYWINEVIFIHICEENFFFCLFPTYNCALDPIFLLFFCSFSFRTFSNSNFISINFYSFFCFFILFIFLLFVIQFLLSF